jgi:hypothetical protein
MFHWGGGFFIMSMAYCRFRHPISSININKKRTSIDIFISGTLIGSLKVNEDNFHEVIDLLVCNGTTLTVFYGGKNKGTCVIKNDPTIENSAYVISDHYEVFTVKEILKGKTVILN